MGASESKGGREVEEREREGRERKQKGRLGPWLVSNTNPPQGMLAFPGLPRAWVGVGCVSPRGSLQLCLASPLFFVILLQAYPGLHSPLHPFSCSDLPMAWEEADLDLFS